MKFRSALIVDDDESVQHLLRVALRDHCHEIACAGDGEQAIFMLHYGSYDLVILDLMLPKANGFAVVESMSSLRPAPTMIVFSAISRYFQDRFPPGAILLQKPFDIARFDDVMRSLTAAGAGSVSPREVRPEPYRAC